MTAQRKIRIQTDDFNLALKDWLSGGVSGHLGPYMYTEDNNDDRWKRGHSSRKYYLGRDDKASFDIMLKGLNVLVDTIFDLGPGGEDSVTTKSVPIAEATMAANYIAVDLSPTLARAAANHVSKDLGIQGDALIANFFNGFPAVGANALVALMGGTLGNLETHKDLISLRSRLSQIFLNYRKAITQSGFLLVSFDANSKTKEILDCYENSQLEDLIRSCIDRAVNTDSFDYRVVWTPENYQLALGLQSKYDQTIRYDGEQYALQQDEFLPVLNSYRFPVPFVIKAAADVGWTHWKTWSATGRVHYLLFTAE